MANQDPTVRYLSPTGLQAPRGFSHIALATGTTLVMVAGQTPVGADRNVIGIGDLAEQTRTAMRNLGTALRAAGATWDHVVARRVYTTRPTDFAVIGDAIAEVTGAITQPPQTVIGVTGLARPEFLIEIEATAVL